MPDIEYKGHADEVRFTKADFERHDIEQGAVVFKSDDRIQEVSQEAYDFLNETHNGGMDFGDPEEPTAPEDEEESPESTSGAPAGTTPAPATGVTKKASKAVKKVT